MSVDRFEAAPAAAISIGLLEELCGQTFHQVFGEVSVIHV